MRQSFGTHELISTFHCLLSSIDFIVYYPALINSFIHSYRTFTCRLFKKTTQRRNLIRHVNESEGIHHSFRNTSWYFLLPASLLIDHYTMTQGRSRNPMSHLSPHLHCYMYVCSENILPSLCSYSEAEAVAAA